MNERQMRACKAYHAVVVFFDTHKQALDLAPELPHLHERLRATTAAIAETSVAQLHRADSLAELRRRLDAIRKNHMLPLASLTFGLFAGEARAQAALRVPHKRAPTDTLIAAAERMTKTLQPHRKFLAGSGIDPQRVNRLRTETQALKKLYADRYARTPVSVLATRRLPSHLERARRDLDAINNIVLATASGLVLVEWRTASRVGKRIGRPRGTKSGRAVNADAHFPATDLCVR